MTFQMSYNKIQRPPLCLRPRLHYTGLHRSVAIFIPVRLLFTLRHSNPVRDAEQKSLRFGGDMKSNPVCAGAV
jgi:hypothetical protein